uniref:Ycf54 n=1 Tax=Porolithon onkodes TaxID=231751 RepID=A0A2Z2KVA8_9FLOR|nr:hypothetical protein [Porolithon onkodes]ASB29637.1 hypothetical protein [Porolithon onkodes]
MKRYYFLIATTDFLFFQEPIEEILRERMRHYLSIEKSLDFCLTTNLDFLDTPSLKQIKENIVTPSAAVVSLNPKFIDWLKLRVRYGITGSFTSLSFQQQNSILLVS